jgi:hypothetical protein
MGLFSFIGGIFGGNKQAKAADAAAKLQFDAQMAGVAETGRQFDITRQDFQPYQALGAGAAPRLGNLTGINGDDAMNAEIERIMGGSRYKSLLQNGRDEMLATASATGGLRGGNFQDASQRFGADTLSSEIGRQLSEYAGLVGIGQGAAGSVGNFGAQAVSDQNTMRNSGADALAQAKLVRGGIAARNWQNAGSFLDNGISSALGGGFNFGNIAKSFF